VPENERMAELDRLGDLIGTQHVPSITSTSDKQVPPELSEHVKGYGPIQDGIRRIQANVEKINRLKAKDRSTSEEKKRKAIAQEVSTVIETTNKIGVTMKSQLEDFKKLNEAYAKENKGSTVCRMRDNLYSTNLRNFKQAWEKYNTVSQQYDDELRDRAKRQLLVLDSTISDEEIEKVIQSGNLDQVMKRVMADSNLREVVHDLEERHSEIQQLEKQVTEIHQLFTDLLALVETQQESLDVITIHIDHARNATVGAEKNLIQAEKAQQKSRKCMCWILLLGLLFLVVVLLSVLLPVLKKS